MAWQTAQVAKGIADVDGSLKKEDRGRFWAQEDHDLVSIPDIRYRRLIGRKYNPFS